MHRLRARIRSDQSEPWRFLVGALLPGVVLSLMVAGPFGLDLPTTRGSYFDTAGDFSMSIASMQHAVRAPWGEIFAPSTFEGGVHLSVSDSYLLLLPLVRLLGNVDAPINLLIVVVPIIAALGLALIARCLGVRGGLAACSIAVIAVGWPPFLLTFLGHELWPHLASVGLMTISMAIAIQIARRSSPALIPLGAAVTFGGFCSLRISG